MDDAQLSRRNKQRRDALATANGIRAARADLKAAMRRGEVDGIALLAGELEEFEALIASWRLETLLPAIPYIGTATAVDVYVAGHFSPTMLVRALSRQRRLELAKLCNEAIPRDKRRRHWH